MNKVLYNNLMAVYEVIKNIRKDNTNENLTETYKTFLVYLDEHFDEIIYNGVRYE